MAFTLRDAHKPYLPEIDMCMCPLCVAVQDARCTCALCMMSAHCDRYDHAAYARAVSDRLLALVEGRHTHRTMNEYVVETFTPEQRAAARRRQPRGYSLGGPDAQQNGLGLGISSHRR